MGFHGITIGGEFHSEINGAFLSAYSDINNDLLRLFALAKYDSGDMRILKQDDITDLDYRLTVKGGSSELNDNLCKILEKVAAELVGKMSGQEIVITVIGLALIAEPLSDLKLGLRKIKKKA